MSSGISVTPSSLRTRSRMLMPSSLAVVADQAEGPGRRIESDKAVGGRHLVKRRADDRNGVSQFVEHEVFGQLVHQELEGVALGETPDGLDLFALGAQV